MICMCTLGNDRLAEIERQVQSTEGSTSDKYKKRRRFCEKSYSGNYWV